MGILPLKDKDPSSQAKTVVVQYCHAPNPMNGLDTRQWSHTSPYKYARPFYILIIILKKNDIK